MTGHRPLGAGSGWRPALRVARRELLRAKGRTLLVLLMVLLPVTAVVGLDTLLRTSEVTAAERLPRDLGGADARIELVTSDRVEQSPDLSQTAQYGGDLRLVDTTQAEVAAVLPSGARLLPVRDDLSERPVRTADDRTARVFLLGVDLTRGLPGPFRLEDGRVPAAADEVAVTRRLARFGFPVGATLRLPDGASRRVTGVVETAVPYEDALTVLGLPSAVGLEGETPRRYYVSGASVTWQDVQRLNALGALVLSRAVVGDPPDVPDLPGYQDLDATTAAVIALVAVIAVLEVVLLAGPAFAVGARRQRRALALMTAGGAEPRHVRRVVLAQGLLVGVTAALLAAVLGIGGAALARAPLSRYAGAVWGPFEVSVRDVVLVCLLGAGTALLAAVAPAVTAAREPVVVALQGRRVVAARAWPSTVVGVVLLVLGCLVLSQAATQDQVAELTVAFAAVPTVLGAALLAPAVLAGLGRLAGRLPLPLRFAVRDADRQRGRTAPAVAAITATVAGVVALGVANASDARQQQDSYGPGGPVGVAVVGGYPGADLARLARAARTALPGERVAEVPGLVVAQPEPSGGSAPGVLVCRPEEPAAASCNGPGAPYGLAAGSTVVVGQRALDALAPLLDPRSLDSARRTLQQGGALVAGAAPGSSIDVRRVLSRLVPGQGDAVARLVAEVTLPAAPLIGRDGAPPPTQAVISEQAGARLGGVGTVGLLVGDDLSRAQERRLQDAVARIDTGASAYVEREPRDGSAIVLLLLFGAAGLLVLGGTLAASSLALSEARPDLATLGSVGARPRTRRAVAASYAFVLALVGAVLGCLAGMVPGVAGAVALTHGQGWYSSEPLAGPPDRFAYVDVPWLLLLGLVVALPVLAGAVAGLSVRSALPGLGRRVRA